MKMPLLAGTLHNIAESPQNGSFFVPGFVRPELNFAISKRSVTSVNTSADEMPVRAQSSSRSQLRYGNAFPNGSDTTRKSVRRTHPCCVPLSNAILHAFSSVCRFTPYHFRKVKCVSAFPSRSSALLVPVFFGLLSESFALGVEFTSSVSYDPYHAPVSTGSFIKRSAP
jgi:hypothetical protein